MRTLFEPAHFERGSTTIIGSVYKTRDEKILLCSGVKVRVNPMSIRPFSKALSY
ncbi:MAG TPA: hypothetical protein VM912_12865 [Terriglobales bacterium]|nr:hypothetical protein [Terriglobales bacterium]